MRIFVPRQLMLLLAAIAYAALFHANTMAGINRPANDQQRPESPATTEATTNSNVTTTSEDTENDTESDEERQATAANERFLVLLTKQPKPGTALDRVYDFHLERGSLDQFLSEQRSLISSGDSTGVACLLVGLIEAKRGNLREASVAFQLAEERRTQDATASWLLGRSLLELQQAEDAAAALERALERSPQKADLLLIFQDLGRAYRRSRQTEKANAVWQRMESQFPSDVRVKEQIATTLLEEGDPEAAVVRFGELSKLHRDPSLKTQSAITAADIKLQLGRRDEALRDLEVQLQTLDPDSWLALDIRRRIEQSFLRNNDQVGLVSYYETWLQNRPDDLKIMARLGHALALQGRGLDAQNWYRKAVEKAPQDVSLRKSLVQQLVRDDLFDEAVTHYQKLHEIDPGNNEHLRDWGLTILYRDDLPLAERHATATAIWKRMLSVRPDEPGVLVQVAELMRRAELPDEALPLYRRAVELAPQNAEYREYLGDYLHTLGRTDEAIRAWEAIVEHDRRTAANLIRLAEVFRATGLQDKAISTMQAACELTPEFNELLKFSRWLREYERDGLNPRAIDALKQLDIAESLAESDEERGLVLAERIQTLVAARQLDQAIRELTLRLQSSEVAGVTANGADEVKKNAVEWVSLAVYLEAAKRFPEAMEAAKKATAIAPESADAWTVAARLYEQFGRYADAVDAYRKLVSLVPRARTKHLQSIAGLEQRLGRRAEALKYGRDLLAAGPENPEFIKFYADLCLHFGERQEAFKTLRRSVRSSAADGTLILTLARRLANQNEIEEATSLCWTAFEKSSSLDDKSSAVMMLAEFSLRFNRFDELVEKLEQHGRVSGQEQDAAQCLATAYRVAGDLKSARQALETFLVADSRDSQLLLQLSRLAEEDGDLEAAADYQRRANSVTASKEGETRLANLLVRLGDLSEADALWTRIGNDTTAPADVIEAIDQLIALESVDSAREICDRVLMQDPGHWEVLIRRGILEWRYGEREKADQFFQRVVDLELNSNAPSAAMLDTIGLNHAGSNARSQRLPALERLEAVSELGEVFHEKSSSSWFGLSSPPAVPQDYGAGRIVALIGRYLVARETRSEAALLEQLQIEASRGPLRAVCDQLGLELFIAQRAAGNVFSHSDFQKFFQASEAGDVEAQAMYLELLARRISVWDEGDGLRSSLDDQATPFISDTEFALVLKSLDSVLAEQPQWLQTFDAARLVCIGRHQQCLDELDLLIAQFTLPDKSGPTLAMGFDLELLRGTHGVESALNRLTQLANTDRLANTSDNAASRFGSEDPSEDLTQRLLRIARLRRSENGMIPALQVLEWWLRWRHDRISANTLTVDSVAGQDVARRVIASIVQTAERSTSGFDSFPEHDAFDMAEQLGLSNHFSSDECEFLTRLLLLLHQQNLKPQWTEWRNRKGESSAVNERLETELLQALFWNAVGDMELVLLHLVRAADYAPDDDQLRLVVALRLAELNMKAESLEVMGQISDSDPVLLKCRELKIFELATELQQPEKVKSALTRLAGLELDDAELVFVGRELGRIGLEDLRAQLEARRTKVAMTAADTSPLALLDHYEQQGDLTAAVQVAQQLLRRSHQNPTPWRNTTRPTPEQIYARAYKVLKETGELEKMIERQKAQLAKSPHSGRLRKTLLDYLKAAGRVTEADELSASWQRNQPGLSADVMIAQAEELIGAKQPHMACDKLLAVIHEHPAEFWSETRNKQVFGVFAETNRLEELADAVLLADRGRSQSCAPTEALEELIKLLLKDPETHGKAAELIHRYSEMYPAYTVSFLMLVEQLPLWSSSDDLFALLTRMYVPSTAGQLQRPQLAWPLDYESHKVKLGFDQTATNSGGNLKRVWDALKFSDERRIELEQSAKDAMIRLPEWPAGPVIQIVCSLSVPDKALNQDRIETLVNELCEDSKPPIPEAVAYNLTQLLRQRGERMKRAAVKLLETSLMAVPEKELNLGRDASIALLDLYSELNESKRGLEFLRRSVLESSTMDLDDQNCDAREHLSRLIAGYFFRVFGRPLAALQVLQGLAPEHDAQISRFGNLEMQRSNAIKSVTVDHILDELTLAVAAEAEGAVTTINLLTTRSSATEQSDRLPVCTLIASIVANSNPDVNTARELSAELATSLMRKHPDLSLIVLGTAMVLKSNDQESIDKALSALEAYMDRGGLTDQLPNETRGNFSRRQNALISLSALASVDAATRTSGPMARLVEQSLACARLKGDREIVIAILHQLQKVHLVQGNQSAGEQLQKELQSEQTAATPSPPKNSQTSVDREQLTEQLKAELRKILLKPSP